MKKILVVAGTLVVLAGIAVAVYAAYDISGSSSAQGFTSGAAADLVVDPEEWDLSGILPGETRWMDILITNNNGVPATVTGLTATFNDGGVCNFTVTNQSPNPYPYGIGANSSVGDGVWVAMGNAAAGCENNSSLTVTATATGWLP